MHVLLFKMKVFIIPMILKKEKLKKVENCAFGGVSKFKNVQFRNFFEFFFLTKIFFWREISQIDYARLLVIFRTPYFLKFGKKIFKIDTFIKHIAKSYIY